MDFDSSRSNSTVGTQDDVFGPRVSTLFDFTLLFEQSILTILPTCLLLVASPLYVLRLAQKPICARRGRLLSVKLATVTVLLAIELAAAILWSYDDSKFRSSSSSLAAASLSCIATLSIAAVAYTEHRRLLSSSAFLSIYLSVTMLFDVAKARSCFLRPDLGSIGALKITTVVLKLFLLLVIETSKRPLLRSALFQPSMGPEVTSGFWTRSLFLWLNRTLLTGFQRVMSVDDLGDLGPEFDSSMLLVKFRSRWETVNKASRYCLPRTCFRTLLRPFLATLIPRLCLTGFNFSQPLLLRAIVKSIGNKNVQTEVTSGLIGATVLVYFGITITKAYSKHLFYRFATMLRGQLASVVFDKALRLNLSDASQSAAVTLMSTDIEGIVGGLTVLHDIWAGIIELALAMFLLATLVGGASFLVIVPALLSTIISLSAAKRMGPARKAWNKSIQERVATTSGILSQLKGLKMTGLSQDVATFLQTLRVKEVDKSKEMRVLSIMLYAITTLSSNITPVVVMAGGLFWANSAKRLSAAEAFATLSVVALVSSPLEVVLNAFPRFVSLASCFSRIQQFLLLDDQIDQRFLKTAPLLVLRTASPRSDVQLAPMKPVPQMMHGEPIIQLIDASLGVPGRADPILKDVNISIKHASLTLILGPVGSGKTTLLRSLLGETSVISGSVQTNHVDMAYCDQTSWLRNTSIRDNILGQTSFDPEWYRTVLRACLLEQDLTQLSNGDSFLVGSSGMNVSGGQRQRIALARALYSRRKILVLDNIFSALDARTGRAIFRNLFDRNGLMRTSRTTTVLATHLYELDMADHVIMLNENGNVSEKSISEVKQLGDAGFGKSTEAEDTSTPNGQSSPDSAATSSNSHSANSGNTATTIDVKAPSNARENSAKETSMRQRGDMSLYKFYLESIGVWAFVPWVILVALSAAWAKMPSILMRIWLESDPNNNTWFAGFAVLGGTSFLCSMAMLTLFMMKLVPTSAESLHWLLVDRVMNATLTFLSKTDTGSILNRFSQDMTLVNQVLPAAFSQFFIYLCAALVDLIIIASGAKYAAAIIPFFLAALYILQSFYLRTSRQIRHLDLEAKAPLYTQFTETASGIQHIRAFAWQTDILRESLRHLNYSQKPYYYMFCIQRWLTLILDLYVTVSAVALVAIALKVPGITTQSAIGLALLNVMMFSEVLAMLMNSWIRLETSLGAIARLKTFLAETPFEADAEETTSIMSLREWPQLGKIELRDTLLTKNVSSSTTSESQPPVLKNVSVVIEPGSKVGIIGRTGSGKSSLLLTLLRLLDYTGTILIDDTDITSLPRQDLRRRITTLPQDAIELSGSVRDNLNPFSAPGTPENTHDDQDAAMREALTRVGIWDHISANGGLDTSLSRVSLSHGQKQLLSLARALLHHARTASRIVIVDEATSSVDSDTDSRMRAVMDEAFAQCTVLVVSHRTETLTGLDVVVELDRGTLVACRRHGGQYR
ncbi:hypothetical protein E4U21_007073 [Claviceps maximensis]|nr:hypothetical protein E4U21_007073 [Claviceps maximensis]